MDPLFPVALRLEGRRIVVVGDGRGAAHKVAELVAAGAQVLVVARALSPELAALAARAPITIVQRAFVEADLDDAWLVLVATSDPAERLAIERAAEARRLFVVALDDRAPAPAASASVTISRAAPDDLPAMAAMAAALVRMHHAFDPRRFLLVDEVEKGYAWWFGQCLGDDRSLLLVAKIDGRPVGYLYGALEDRDWNALLDACGAIHDVWVEDEARRAGVARALVEAACAHLRELGAPRVVLHTASENVRAQGFFAGAGFRPTMIEMTRELGSGDSVSGRTG